MAMDPLSIIASAISIVQITEQIWTLLQQYSLAVKDAETDIHRLSVEILALRSIFEKIEDLKIEVGSAKLKTLDLLCKNGGLIQQCLCHLRDLASKLNSAQNQTPMRRVGWRALKWPFTTKDVNKKIAILERYKATFNLAISTDDTCVLCSLTSRLHC